MQAAAPVWMGELLALLCLGQVVAVAFSLCSTVQAAQEGQAVLI